MSISTGNNLIALRLSAQMRSTNQRIGAVFERVSTGNRINRAADDPAGLAIADKLRLDTRLMSAAISTTSQAVSLVTVTDDALVEVANILSRMSELALQGASSSFSSTQRSAMQQEFNALGSEIDRISSAVVFNGNTLLSASAAVVAQVGITSDSFSRITVQSVLATLNFLGLGSGSALTYSLTGTTSAYAASASGTAYSALQNAIADITEQRGIVGAVSARLSSAISNLSLTREATLAAESFIREADTATETAELVRLQVLQSIQTSLFAQANQLAGRVVALLGD
jgi:flagellin